MTHPHRKPITAAEFRELANAAYHPVSAMDHHVFLMACIDFREHIALALEAMEERANSEVM